MADVLNLPRLLLASASPRRRELLAAAGVHCRCLPADVDETPRAGEAPEATVLRLAAAKAATIAALHPTDLVLGADTMVFCEEHALGKPVDEADARRMLRLLSGRTHQVLTGVSLQRVSPASNDTWFSRTLVTFRQLDAGTIDEYMRRVETRDKAGAYAIQEHGDLIVVGIAGLRSNVIGLPVEEVLERLARLSAPCKAEMHG